MANGETSIHEEFKETEIGVLPENWGVVRIGDLANVKYGKQIPKNNKGKVPVVGSGGVFTWTKASPN